MNVENKNIIYCNIANIITLFRLIMSIVYVVIVNLAVKSSYGEKSIYCLFFCILLICLSDFFDGRVARLLKIESVFGQYFDVVVDFLYVLVAHLQMIIYGIMPAWFLIVIIERIFNYIFTSYIYHKRSKSTIFFVKDTIGKYVAASFFVTPFIMCLLQKLSEHGALITNGILWILTLGSIFSTIARFYQVLVYERVRKKGDIVCE